MRAESGPGCCRDSAIEEETGERRAQKLFNSSLEGNTRRAIDICEGEKLNEAAFNKLIRSAVAANSAARARPASPKK